MRDPMRKLIVSLFLLSLIIQPVLAVQAASLWAESGSAANVFTDRKAHAIGDIITIIISETSSATRSGKAENSKAANAKADAGVGVFGWIAAANANSSDSFESQGSIANTNKVTARITVQVSEVKPNGHLVVTGKQSIKQNGEEQRIIITGTIRPEDISADNTVYSTYVANAEIKIDGHGPLARKQRQGILTQIFNFLF